MVENKRVNRKCGENVLKKAENIVGNWEKNSGGNCGENDGNSVSKIGGNV